MQINIRVKPTKLLFENEDDFYAIWGAEVHPEDENKDGVKLNSHGNISFKGYMHSLNRGEEYEVVLTLDTRSGYAGSYNLESIKQKRKETIEEQKRFFESILTPNQVKNIYDVYNENQDVIGMIENDEFDYTKVKGLGEKSYKKLHKKVMDNIDMSEVISFLAKYDIKYNLIRKLVKEYKNPEIVIQKIKQNPYSLTELRGIGFKKADAIAVSVGFEMSSPHRIKSAVKYIIGEENRNGHSWVSYRDVLNKSVDLLNIKRDSIKEVLENNISGVIKTDEKFTLNYIYEAEKYIAEEIIKYSKLNKKVFSTEYVDEFLDTYCSKNNVELEESQRQFFHDWNENQFLLLIGNGGTGKSYLQKILLEMIKDSGLSKVLMSPTGRASKVQTGYTGVQAFTIHRRAGIFNDADFAAAEIDEDVVIIDEASMCDVIVLSKLLKAITNPHVRILFVGDDFQLPSVGVGNFLFDAINSKRVKVSKLKRVFRQKDGGILNVATDTREGKQFLNNEHNKRLVFGKDCVFWLVDSQFILDGVLSNYKKALGSGRWKMEDIAIATPTNKGKLGTAALNKEIQKIANPKSDNKKEKSVGSKDNPTIFRVGDLVMNVVNTYDADTLDGGLADVYNGDTGVITDINDEEKIFVVRFDGIDVIIEYKDVLNNLVHGWCATIHKLQGSQFDVVILVVDKSMSYQLNANLLYTGESRAKEYMLVLTQARTINNAMRKKANMQRRSFLMDFLKNPALIA